MKKKQIISLIIAAVILVVVGITGVVTAVLGNIGNKAASAIGSAPTQDYVGIVRIEGTMNYSTTTTTSPFAAATNTYNHQAILKNIREMAKDKLNKGILLYVNSGGGAAYAGDDLYLELMDYKEKTGRPVYAYFDSIACSAAYDLSMSADEIYANRMTTTGAIGVYMTTYDLSKLFDKYGIREVMIKSGENKGMGSPGQEFTDEQIAVEQSQVDEMYDIFITNVANGRGMTKDQVRELADGRTYTANQALENGLIDGISRYEDYKNQVKGYFPGKITFYEKGAKENSIYSLLGAFVKAAPKSDNQVLLEMMELNQDKGGSYESIYR